MREYEVINYHMEQYQKLIEQMKLYEVWKLNNHDEYKWNYTGKIPTQAEMKRTRLILHKLMLDVERNIHTY
ncbi:hypothetical protein [Mammaliicoccus sp. L-M44]|uniref:hypothetical protein n=2 Tax=Staphylococcaceae TaxID=90964 RepID=UPI001EFAEEA5|nr:hypothetical protein [Mammaliicoccus sp. L-M44]